MKKKSKALLVLLSAVALVVATMFGTLAYLTDTDTNTNTFTVGKVELLLDELDSDNDNDKSDVTKDSNPARDKNNEYHLLPGVPVTKDPTVTVIGGSEATYVRMKVKVDGLQNLKNALSESKYYANDVFLLQYLCDWDPDGDWKYAGFDSTKDTYEFRYANKVEKSDSNTKLPALFSEIMVPGADVNNTELGLLKDVKIIVTAEAIQADGFTDAADAWDDFPANP